ncbi:MAG: radical SAM protein [Planctomycetes bacterium]|nr:radical SAM protein [Planctomycetota bacterium]
MAAALDAAEKHLRCCRLCPRSCRVDRVAGERGYCGLDDKAHCFREMLHHAEEAELTPSHQVYFTGCNLRCGHCTVAEWNEQPLTVPEMDLEGLVEAVDRRQQQGARNVNLLGGEPTVSLPGVLTLLGRIRTKTAVVLNSNMYYNECVDNLLRGLVDVCLADLKCGSRGCAAALLDAGDYVEVARDNLRRAVEHTDLIVRHLILPGHADCCMKPTLEWLAAELPQVKVSLRANYVPPIGANAAPARYVTSQEAEAAVRYARDLGLRLIQ